jgi:cytochrome c-type biogenesis protein CcmF
MFYTVTAFWAGQDGSFLLWGWLIALCSAVFVGTRGYRELPGSTRVWFWLFMFAVQAFFLYILTGPNNPFLKFSPAPADGNGMNPLLRHPGMIFHPPLLFMGYAGFTVPACLALANVVTGSGATWLRTCRRWTLLSWTFLTAGIILGAWWSYMELGWGGYWAWDPVENASLIPWMGATAFLHTALVQATGRSLEKTNVFLIALTLILCFFATYTVRSGVIDSLHAFGSGELGGPLVVFMVVCLVTALLAVVSGMPRDVRPLSEFVSRQGLLLVTAWLLLAIGAVILMGTMWPVISNIWSQNPEGLKPGFYNRVCLPLFTLAAVLLTICPWLGWKGGVKRRKPMALVGAVAAVFLAVLWFMGVTLPLALIGAAAGLTVLAGIVILFTVNENVRRRRTAWGAYGVHFGLALMVLGIAVSGPYKAEKDVTLNKGESFEISGYDVTYMDMSQQSGRNMAVAEAVLEVTRDGEAVGVLRPQRRIYRNFSQPYAEVSTIFGMGREIYATLISFDQKGAVSITVSVHPMVNWIWVGGTLMCVFPFLALTRRKRRIAAEAEG